MYVSFPIDTHVTIIKIQNLKIKEGREKLIVEIDFEGQSGKFADTIDRGKNPFYTAGITGMWGR